MRSHLLVALGAVSLSIVASATNGCSSSSGSPSSGSSSGDDSGSGSGSSSGASSGSSSGSSSGGKDGGAPSNGTWTVVKPIVPSDAHPKTVTGLWFGSMTSGAVSFQEGVIEHFDGPSHIDAVALDAHASPPGAPASDSYLGLFANQSGVAAISGNTNNAMVTSSDQGKTFQYSKLYGQTSVPSTVKGQIQLGGVTVALPRVWVGSDSSGTWHAIDLGDGTWSSPTAPGPNATFTLDFHPEGTITVPSPIPKGDCTWFNGNGYFSMLPGQIVGVSPDGNTMLYGTGGQSGSSPKLCRSTDGGKNFLPVTLPSFSSAFYPWVIAWATPMAAIAAYGTDAGTGKPYVYATSDGGATWTQGTLPSSATSRTAIIYGFGSPNGKFWLGGANANGLVLFKSSDGGSTWTDVSAKLAQIAGSAGSPQYATAGFALDDNDIWVGAQSGFIAYSATGGE